MVSRERSSRLVLASRRSVSGAGLNEGTLTQPCVRLRALLLAHAEHQGHRPAQASPRENTGQGVCETRAGARALGEDRPNRHSWHARRYLREERQHDGEWPVD